MTEAASPWVDETDVDILDRLRAVYAVGDPPPADMDERVGFAIALDYFDVEVSRLREDLMIGSGARSTERTRTITFDSESLTIMVSIVERPGGLVRLDGWLAPPGPLRVELRTAGPQHHGPIHVVTADDTGRFVFDGVGRGLGQLLVRGEGGAGGAGTTVVTPSLTL
jgi:hypothetical protein